MQAPPRQTARLRFLRQFLRDPRSVGSITPSSLAYTRAVADQVDFGRAKVVLEYGPGTGSFTRELLRRLAPGAQLVSIEYSTDMVEHLRASITDPRFTVVHGSAEDVEQILLDLDIKQVDAVVSGLPFASLPEELRIAVLDRTVQLMAPGAPFVAIQYLPFTLPALLRPRFDNVRAARWVPNNIPPGFVYVGNAPGATPEEVHVGRPHHSTYREARGVLAAVAGGALALGLVRRRWGLYAALAIPLVAAFYRDPERTPERPLGPRELLSPAEGRVMKIGPAKDSRGEDCLEISIFLSVHNVHVQRAPMDGVVVSRLENPGKFLPAFLHNAGEENQHTVIRIEGKEFSCEVIQAAGLVARRIVTWVTPGDQVETGQQLGMIKFGSQVSLRVPPGARPLVRQGQAVRVGETILAEVE